MRGRIFRIVASSIVAAAIAPVAARAQEGFPGEYDGDALSVRIAPAADAYAGEIQKGGQRFPLKAHEEGGRLVGSFSTPNGDFNFTATPGADGLTLASGGKTFNLKKHTSAELAGYTVVNSTDFGKALTVEKPDAASVTAALQATFPELARYFGAKPVIVGVFEDVKDHRTGGASFTAKLNGQAVNGFVSCKIGQKGATVAIVYCRADAPKSEWGRLIAKPAAGAAPVAADFKLREYQFPDGTGTVEIAEGWKTNSPSLMTGVVIQGPADQEVNLAMSASVSTPDSQMVQMYQQMVANARQWGMAPPPPLPITTLIAPYTDPATAIKDLFPQFSRIIQAGGGPALSLEKIISVDKVNTMIPNGQAALIVFDMTKTLNGVAKHYRSGMRWDMAPVVPGGWMITTSQVTAPRETYDRDLPAMLAMTLSLTENPQVIMEKTQINIEAANARFAAQQRANKELQAAYDSQRKSWEHNELVQSRGFADFDETIIGYRTVEDTTTGYHTSVDLGNVHEIVDHLNRYDPGRYKEIPLRDEMYPLPGR